MHVFGEREETEEPKGDPWDDKDDIKTLHRQELGYSTNSDVDLEHTKGDRSNKKKKKTMSKKLTEMSN